MKALSVKSQVPYQILIPKKKPVNTAPQNTHKKFSTFIHKTIWPTWCVQIGPRGSNSKRFCARGGNYGWLWRRTRHHMSRGVYGLTGRSETTHKVQSSKFKRVQSVSTKVRIQLQADTERPIVFQKLPLCGICGIHLGSCTT